MMESLLTREGTRDIVAVLGQVVLYQGDNVWFVINDKNARPSHNKPRERNDMVPTMIAETLTGKKAE